MTDPQALVKAITALYPEIAKHGIDVSVSEDQAAKAWRVTMRHGKHSLSTHLEHKDADACLLGEDCVNLGVQIGRFVENYCLGQGECPI